MAAAAQHRLKSQMFPIPALTQVFWDMVEVHISAANQICFNPCLSFDLSMEGAQNLKGQDQAMPFCYKEAANGGAFSNGYLGETV